MTPTRISPKVLSWASDLDDNTAEQAARTSRMPFVADPLALMPDAHYGKGSTVGSVIATDGAIMPAAVGVDIGCGMIAARTTLTASRLPDDLGPLLSSIERDVPAGMGKGHDEASAAWDLFAHENGLTPTLAEDDNLVRRAAKQFGTLGSGNHFVEVCLDEDARVWVMLHSGSRGVGNMLAQRHIARAGAIAALAGIELEDPDLAWFTQGTPEFSAYIRDMRWAQAYARENREAMMDAVLNALVSFVGWGPGVGLPIGADLAVNCHHNYTTIENHQGRLLWVTRKGAIDASAGRLGIIPGSMGTGSFIVRGKGNAESWNSCSHGAGRRMSRGRARRELSVESLTAAMEGKTWLGGHAEELLDEHPDSYKDIGRVMADQTDLVDVVHSLTSVLNYKGVDAGYGRKRRRR